MITYLPLFVAAECCLCRHSVSFPTGWDATPALLDEQARALQDIGWRSVDGWDVCPSCTVNGARSL